MGVRQTIATTPVIGPFAAFLYRGAIATRHLTRTAATLLQWWFRSRETSNFTYELTALNKAQLTAIVADVTGHAYELIEAYVHELETDGGLIAHIRSSRRTRRDQLAVDPHVHYGRRLGWYAIARALKPRTIVETGVDKGLGSCVLCAALARNADEGHPGRYYGLDINPKAGYLLSEPYNRFGEIVVGDSLTTLRAFDGRIDLFINDSDHSLDYESAEYDTIATLLTPEAFILSDNAHISDRLLAFARATGRRFVFFREEPADHWYRGAGIGIAFPRR